MREADESVALAGELRLEVGMDLDADVAELDAAARQLREELLVLDVDAVERPAGAAPEGARAAELAVAGALVVHVGQATISAVVRIIERWVARRSGRSVKVTLGADSIELTNAGRDVQQRLIEAFLERHSDGA